MKKALFTQGTVTISLAILCHSAAFSQELQPIQPVTPSTEAPVQQPPQGSTVAVAVAAPTSSPNKTTPEQPKISTNDSANLDAINAQKNSALSSALLTSVSNGTISEEALQKLNDASQRVKNTCAERFRYYAKQRNERAAWSVTTALVGSLAGGVIAPAILAGGGSKVAAAAFSGLSGATNTAQKMVADQGYTVEASQVSSGKVREGVQQALSEYRQAYVNSTLAPQDRLVQMKAALMKADDACFLGEY